MCHIDKSSIALCFRVFFALSFCGMSIGQTSAFIPDYVKARLSAALIFHMIEYPSRIDSYSSQGQKPVLNSFIFLAIIVLIAMCHRR